MSEAAERAGAVNVVVQQGDPLWGHTDGRGFLDALGEKPTHTMVLLGQGRPEPSLRQRWRRVREIIVLNRSAERAVAMLAHLRAASPRPG